jgi:ABC-2 type transport system ATP-binding protein
MSHDAIEVEHVTKRFGTTVALDSVDLLAESAKVLGLLGPNGAGKTTLIRILSTLLRPDSGRARVEGHDVVEDAAAVRFLIGLAGQYAAVDELLTGRENLELVGLWYHLDRREYERRAAAALERFGLSAAGDRLVKGYSGGMRRRLDIAASLIGEAPVVFLDEPTTGLDPKTRNDVWAYIEELVANGTTVLLTTQYMEEAERLAHRIVVLDEGHVIANGTAEELKDRLGGDVIEARVARAGDLEASASILGSLNGGAAHTDLDRQTVTVPSKGGTKVLLEAARRLEDAGIAVEDLGTRRPSLDDVFLALTGKRAEADEDGAAGRDGASRP